MWIEGSGHVITEEPQRETVFRAAADFITRVEGGETHSPGTTAGIPAVSS
jgi:hypothetical protein